MGVRLWGGPQPQDQVPHRLQWPCGVLGDAELRPLMCRVQGQLEQQQQEIIQHVPDGFYQTEIILHYGAFKVAGSLCTLITKGMVMLQFVR